MRAPFVLLVLLFLPSVGCQRPAASGGLSDAEFFEEQVETWRRQSEKTEKLMDDQEAQTIRYERILKAQEEDKERFEKLLSKWEEQAQRMDAILAAEEKKAGIKPSPPAVDPASPAKEGGARVETESTRGIANEADMIRILGSRLPAGTPLETARAFMKEEGFECSLKTKGRFGDREGIDYLYCDRSEASGMFLVSRRWQVAIIVRDEKVVEIDASTGLVGL
jgi:hypothetical protein